MNLERLSKNAVSYSSASMTKNGEPPPPEGEGRELSRAEMPKFCSTPPIKKLGFSPAYSSIHASIALVVVLPCVPATASTHRSCRMVCASHCGPVSYTHLTLPT